MKTKIGCQAAAEAVFRALESAYVRAFAKCDITDVRVVDVNTINFTTRPTPDTADKFESNQWTVYVRHHTGHNLGEVQLVGNCSTHDDYVQTMNELFFAWNGPFAVKRVGESFHIFQSDGRGWQVAKLTLHKHHCQPLRDLLSKLSQMMVKEDAAQNKAFKDNS